MSVEERASVYVTREEWLRAGNQLTTNLMGGGDGQSLSKKSIFKERARAGHLGDTRSKWLLRRGDRFRQVLRETQEARSRTVSPEEHEGILTALAWGWSVETC